MFNYTKLTKEQREQIDCNLYWLFLREDDWLEKHYPGILQARNKYQFTLPSPMWGMGSDELFAWARQTPSNRDLLIHHLSPSHALS